MKGVLIYSYICPKLPFNTGDYWCFRYKTEDRILEMATGQNGILIQYYGSRNDVPYNYMFLKANGSLYEGVAAIPFIIGSLLGR